MIWSLLGDFGPWLIGVAGAVLALLGARQAGANKVKRDVAEKRADALQARKEVADDIQGMDDQRVHNELSKWMRKSSGE